MTTRIKSEEHSQGTTLRCSKLLHVRMPRTGDAPDNWPPEGGPMLRKEHHPIIDGFLLLDRQRLPPIFKLVGVFHFPHIKSISYS